MTDRSPEGRAIDVPATPESVGLIYSIPEVSKGQHHRPPLQNVMEIGNMLTNARNNLSLDAERSSTFEMDLSGNPQDGYHFNVDIDGLAINLPRVLKEFFNHARVMPDFVAGGNPPQEVLEDILRPYGKKLVPVKLDKLWKRYPEYQEYRVVSAD